MKKIIAVFVSSVLTFVNSDDFVSSPFRLDMRVEDGRRVAEAAGIVQTMCGVGGFCGEGEYRCGLRISRHAR